jgi:hypothetical protein
MVVRANQPCIPLWAVNHGRNNARSRVVYRVSCEFTPCRDEKPGRCSGPHRVLYDGDQKHQHRQQVGKQQPHATGQVRCHPVPFVADTRRVWIASRQLPQGVPRRFQLRGCDDRTHQRLRHRDNDKHPRQVLRDADRSMGDQRSPTQTGSGRDPCDRGQQCEPICARQTVKCCCERGHSKLRSRPVHQNVRFLSKWRLRRSSPSR